MEKKSLVCSISKQWMGSSSITPRNDSTSATHTPENSTQLFQANMIIWWHTHNTWKHTVDKSQTNAASVITSATNTPPKNFTVGSSKHDNLMTHMKHTAEKISWHILKTHSGENLMTHIFKTHSGEHLMTHILKTHSGEKSNKCSQCSYFGHLHSPWNPPWLHILKTHIGEKSNAHWNWPTFLLEVRMKVCVEKYLSAEMRESNIYRKDLGRGGGSQ